jgi:hypothetical protein
VLGLFVAAFLGLFALDAFDAGPSTAALSTFGVHLLPALVVALVAGVGWKYPWLGAIGFGLLAAAYSMTDPYRFDWILVISGPLAVVAVLFGLSAATKSRV